MQITHNLMAMNAKRQLGIVSTESNKTLEKLSTGYRINRAADNAADLSISEKMRWQIRGLDKAAVNCREAHSMCRVSDGSMEEIEDMIHRMRELVTQGANDTNTEEDREDIQLEINSLIEEIDRVSFDSSFNEKPVFGPVRITKEYEINETTNEKVLVGVTKARVGSRIGLIELLGEENVSSGTRLEEHISGGSGWSPTSSDKVLESGKMFQSAWLDFKGLDTGAYQKENLIGQGFSSCGCNGVPYYSISFRNGGGDSFNNGSSAGHEELVVDISSCNSGSAIANRIVDAVQKLPDNSLMKSKYTQYAVNTSEPTKLYIFDNRWRKAQDEVKTWTGSIWQISLVEKKPPSSGRGSSTFDTFSRGVDGLPHVGSVTRTVAVAPGIKKVYEYENEEGLWIQTGATQGNGITLGRPDLDSSFLGVRSLGVYDYESASASLSAIDSAIDILNLERSTVGAYMNRLEKAISVDESTSENTQAAESRIRDADMSQEVVALAKHNILQQAGQSMLAQANHNPENIIKLFEQ